MNERRFLAGMALVAGVVLLNAPLNAAVESDVVGYTTMTMEAGKWYQVGNPLVPGRQSLRGVGRGWSAAVK